MHVIIFFRGSEDVAPLVLLLRQYRSIPWVRCEHFANFFCQTWSTQVLGEVT
jgi:hypothetical protein